MSTGNAALLAICAALTLVGCPPTHSAPCSTDEECPAGRCRFGACGPACFDDGECATSEQCVDGACAARPQCTQTSECASGFTCTAGRCACSADTACATNQTCQKGECLTKVPCRSSDECLDGKRCEVTQGLCLPACTLPTDCAPGVDPAVANALFFCQAGDCLRRCVNDPSCGQGLICRDGYCRASECTTLSECPPGRLCTSATFGRCQEYTTCTSDAQCEANFECRPFTPEQCPPGFACEQPICQELPRCLIDADCSSFMATGPAYCDDRHCQQSLECFGTNQCPGGQTCVANVCVPGGCRGHSDCPSTERCTDGACRSAPPANDIRSLLITPRVDTLFVGATLQLQLVAFRFDGSSFPLQTASFAAIDADGQPSTAVTVDESGLVTGVAAGTARISATFPDATAPAAETFLTVFAPLTDGKRVIVLDASTRRPLSGVTVLGCDAPPAADPCPAPESIETDGDGIALFPAFTGATAHFTVASSELRGDGLPRFDLVSIVSSPAGDVLVPLGENPVRAAAGFTASISFTEVHGTGNYWIGFAVQAVADLPSLDLRRLLGDTFNATFPGTGQRFPIPGSVVAYQSPAFGFANELKARAYGLGEAGRRNLVAFAGKNEASQALSIRSTELLAYAGSYDYAIEPPALAVTRPLVPDTTDLDGDGRCTDAQRCPNGSELIPDYNAFPSLGFAPRRQQQRRTEVIIPNVPQELDTVIIAAVETGNESGVVPLGLSSRAAGQPGAMGTRPVQPVVLRSGAPYSGVETGQPGILAIAVPTSAQTSERPSSATARLTMDGRLPVRVALPPFLPLASGTSYLPATRTLTMAQPQWNAVASAGADLARVTLTGSQVRHVMYFPVGAAQTTLRVPEGAIGGVADPAAELMVGLEVVALDLRSGVTVSQALDSSGSNLSRLPLILSGYSRFIPE